MVYGDFVMNRRSSNATLGSLLLPFLLFALIEASMSQYQLGVWKFECGLQGLTQSKM